MSQNIEMDFWLLPYIGLSSEQSNALNHVL
jgi:hypothetical protein